jgi:FKBP-type peptidyl-prolyl cis-trans isomerase
MQLRPYALLRGACLALTVVLAFTGCKSSPDEPGGSTESASETPSAEAPSDVPATPDRSAEPEEPKKPAGEPAPSDVAAAPKDAVVTKSGLATKVISAGTGKDKAKPTDKVKVHYTGWTKSGEMFDSSRPRGEPTTFGVTEVIPGWVEGLQLMVVGEKRRMWIPSKLAYGETPAMPGAPAGDLVFDVELVEITSPPEVPADLTKPPATAKKTASGLKYRELAKGTGKKHPTKEDRVIVHYSGWTQDGKMFDSSVSRGAPATFGVSQVIKGWTEGLQLMVEGQKVRFWIPADLAYGDTPKRPGSPSGLLVFDVELIQIK